mmetsp:Transcript_48792/g.103735  ORF Transcript_48792/g.103735 Transcript_48792/m.103735 type:complete len:215 (+) Transcript_48792:97-741(+)
MMAKQEILSVLVALLAFIGCGTAFQLPRHVASSTRTGVEGSGAPPAAGSGNAATAPTATSLGMAPRFDKATQKWFTTSEEEGPSAGYNVIGSLYRAGPVPFLQRIVNADTYEQAVLKYMAQEGCDRVEAQGNMDAFLENPQDWAYQKMSEKNGGARKDYANANMDPQQIILSTVWACVVFAFAYDLVTGVAEGRYGKADGTDILHGNIFSLPSF